MGERERGGITIGMRPKDGLSPNVPVKLAGMRILPPPSAAVTRGTIRAAIAADAP
jgi:hypothetical protein